MYYHHIHTSAFSDARVRELRATAAGVRRTRPNGRTVNHDQTLMRSLWRSAQAALLLIVLVGALLAGTISPAPSSAATQNLLAATGDNRLWVRDPVLADINWSSVGPWGHPAPVAMAYVPTASPSVFVATSDNGLWAGYPNSCFGYIGEFATRIGHANGVRAMTYLNGKLFAATSDNRLWARDPVLADINWQLIGRANDVRAMAAVNGKLFAATSDNRLWARDPGLADINWQLIGHANDVTTMTAGATPERCLN
jgi:hypothetical protein